MRRHKPDPPPEDTLLGDLESIRALLETRGTPSVETPADALDETGDVPMLEDVVDGAFQLNESPLASRRAFEDDLGGPSALADETIEALLSDSWRESAEGIIQGARQALDAAAARWSDSETAALEAALRARIDDALRDWMAEITLNHIDELRQRLLEAIDAEVRNITEQLSQGSHGE